MGIRRWYLNRKRNKAERLKRTYDELSAEFLETYIRLKQLFYELKEAITGRLSIEEVLIKLNQFYETYQQFLKSLEILISIDNRWQDIDSKLGFFGRGVTYLFKYENNFDYDKALRTLNTMETGLKNAEVSLNKLELRAVA